MGKRKTDIDNVQKLRRWQITINNPIDKGWTHEALKNVLQEMSVVYWCMADEQASTFHTHIYVVFKNQVRLETMCNKFKGGHFDVCEGNSRQNRDYVFKEGKWLDSEKGTTNFRDSHEEWGVLPEESQGIRADMAELYDLIKQGCSNYEILETNPRFILHMDKVERARQIVREEKFKKLWRWVETTYIWGTTGAGKTRSVMDEYGYSNVYRVTDYEHPFDSYKGQDVLVFEEFRSSLRIDDMLKYLDGYPLELPARYMNRVACFTKIFIISNIDIRNQYPNIQKEEKETWNAFLRRIKTVKVYINDTVREMPLDTYLKYEYPFLISTPFDSEVIQ